MADFLRENCGFGHVIGLGLSSETATEKRHVTDDILFGNSQFLRNNLLPRLRVLCRSPGRDFAILELCSGYHRLHRSVRQQRDVIISLENPAALGKGRLRVALVAYNFPLLTCSGLQLLLILLRIVGCVRPVIPFDLELLASLKSGPGVIGDDSDAA